MGRKRKSRIRCVAEEKLECEVNETDVVTKQPKTSYCSDGDGENIGNIGTDPGAVEI